MEAGESVGLVSFSGAEVEERSSRLTIRGTIEVEGGSVRDRREAAALLGTALSSALAAGHRPVRPGTDVPSLPTLR